MTQLNYTVEQVQSIVAEAKTAARVAAEKFFQERLGGVDQYACGFAWVDIFGVKGNSRLGRTLKAAGIEQNHNRTFSIWNPSGLGVQNVDVKECGADAAAQVFQKYGFDSFAGSRLD